MSYRVLLCFALASAGCSGGGAHPGAPGPGTGASGGAAGGSAGTSGSSGTGGAAGAPSGPGGGKYDWLQFGFSPDKMANLDFAKVETTVNAGNVAMLTQIFQVPIPDAPDGAPVGLSDVKTPMGVKDLI